MPDNKELIAQLHGQAGRVVCDWKNDLKNKWFELVQEYDEEKARELKPDQCHSKEQWHAFLKWMESPRTQVIIYFFWIRITNNICLTHGLFLYMKAMSKIYSRNCSCVAVKSRHGSQSIVQYRHRKVISKLNICMWLCSIYANM